MKVYYRLDINSDSSKETYDSITDILMVLPTQNETKLPTESIYNMWSYEKVSEENDDYVDFISHFLDLLNNKYQQLQVIGINRKDIQFWLLYEYDQQCNLEFNPEQLQRLGNNGIGLCISCWESGNGQN